MSSLGKFGGMIAALLLLGVAAVGAQEKPSPGSGQPPAGGQQSPGGGQEKQRPSSGMTQVTGTVQTVDPGAKTVTVTVAKVRQGRGSGWQEPTKDLPGAAVKEGKVLLTLGTTDQTRFGRRGASSKGGGLADLKAGDSLLIVYTLDNGKPVATGVRLVPSTEQPAPGSRSRERQPKS